MPKNDKDNELTTLSVYRRVYVQRDEERQVATMMHNSELNHLMRVGSLIFLSVGQLLPHQLPVFHTSNYIYPVGYKIVSIFVFVGLFASNSGADLLKLNSSTL